MLAGNTAVAAPVFKWPTTIVYFLDPGRQDLRGLFQRAFELYNEPHPNGNSVPNQNIWACWQNGCQITSDGSVQGVCNCTPSYPGVGMQTLVNTVRAAGANNLVLVAGTNWGFNLSQLSSFPITGANIVYDTHPYPYGGKCLRIGMPLLGP